MSKGTSGLFRHTSGANTTRAKLLAKAKEAVGKLIAETPNSYKKAMAVGAYDQRTGKTTAAFAGEIPNRIAPELRKRAEAIGGIGSHGLTDRNTVGVCAEFHVVNNLLLGGAKWEDIRLTPAIRPRTGQAIPYCANCQTMFHDLIEK